MCHIYIPLQRNLETKNDYKISHNYGIHYTDISGQPVRPKSKSQVAQEWVLDPLQDGNARFPRNLKNKLPF